VGRHRAGGGLRLGILSDSFQGGLGRRGLGERESEISIRGGGAKFKKKKRRVGKGGGREAKIKSEN